MSGTNFDPSIVGPGVTTISYTYLDEFGCTSVVTDDITVSAAATVTSVNTNPPVFCGGTDGFLIVNSIQGSTSPQFRLDGGAWQYSNFFSGLATGDYVLEIRNDDDNCIHAYPNNPITINDSDPPLAQIISPPSAVSYTHLTLPTILLV